MPSDLLLPERFNNQADNPPNIQGRKTPGSIRGGAKGAEGADSSKMRTSSQKVEMSQVMRKPQNAP